MVRLHTITRGRLPLLVECLPLVPPGPVRLSVPMLISIRLRSLALSLALSLMLLELRLLGVCLQL